MGVFGVLSTGSRTCNVSAISYTVLVPRVDSKFSLSLEGGLEEIGGEIWCISNRRQNMEWRCELLYLLVYIVD